ncbi:hypothetical protein DXG01_009077 [Tephrocybe rancida]|nr:hypothetical protein DXG01_009077 [Tephrocybe rancida]
MLFVGNNDCSCFGELCKQNYTVHDKDRPSYIISRCGHDYCLSCLENMPKKCPKCGLAFRLVGCTKVRTVGSKEKHGLQAQLNKALEEFDELRQVGSLLKEKVRRWISHKFKNINPCFLQVAYCDANYGFYVLFQMISSKFRSLFEEPGLAIPIFILFPHGLLSLRYYKGITYTFAPAFLLAKSLLRFVIEVCIPVVIDVCVPRVMDILNGVPRKQG